MAASDGGGADAPERELGREKTLKAGEAERADATSAPSAPPAASRAASARASAAQRTFARMTTAPVAPLVLRLGVPTMLSMLVTALYNTASTYYVSYLGTSAVGAMGVVFALQMVIQAIGIMIGQGCASQASRLLGAKNYARANELASSAIFAVLAGGAAFAAAGLALLDPILSAMGATETILPYARAYAQAVLLAAPFMAGAFTLNNILRSEGLALVGMIGLGIGGLLNVAIAPLFIFTFGWGIAGAAWATALCQTLSFFILLSHYWRGKGSIAIERRFVSRKAETYLSLIKNGTPSLTRNLLGAAAAAALNLMAGRFGDAGVAGMSMVGRIMMMTGAAMIGIGQGFQPVLGYNWGAKKFGRVKRALDATLLMATALMAVLGALGFVFAEEVIRFFKTNDPAVIAVGVLALKLQCAVAPIVPVNVISNMTYQVLGRAGIATLLASTRQGLFFLPFILILPNAFGLIGLQTAQPLAELCSFLICAWFVVKFRLEVAERERRAH